jgi:hypothetical protein
VTNLELQTQDIVDRGKAFDTAIMPRLGDPDFHPPGGDGKICQMDWETDTGFDDEFHEEFEKVISDDSLLEANQTFTPDIFDDTYVNIELALPRVGGEQNASGTKMVFR